MVDPENNPMNAAGNGKRFKDFLVEGEAYAISVQGMSTRFGRFLGEEDGTRYFDLIRIVDSTNGLKRVLARSAIPIGNEPIEHVPEEDFEITLKGADTFFNRFPGKWGRYAMENSHPNVVGKVQKITSNAFHFLPYFKPAEFGVNHKFAMDDSVTRLRREVSNASVKKDTGSVLYLETVQPLIVPYSNGGNISVFGFEDQDQAMDWTRRSSCLDELVVSGLPTDARNVLSNSVDYGNYAELLRSEGLKGLADAANIDRPLA
jgi:hypothetical protein